MELPTMRGVVYGHTVVLSEDAGGLPDGTEVLVTPVASLRRGSPEAVLAALAKHPPMSDEVAAKMLSDIQEAFGQVEEDD